MKSSLNCCCFNRGFNNKENFTESVQYGAPNAEVLEGISSALIPIFFDRIDDNAKLRILSQALEDSDIKVYMKAFSELLKDTLTSAKWLDIKKMPELAFYSIIIGIHQALPPSDRYYASKIANVGGRVYYYLISGNELWIFEDKIWKEKGRTSLDKILDQISGDRIAICIEAAELDLDHQLSSLSDANIEKLKANYKQDTQHKELIKGINKIVKVAVIVGNSTDNLIESWQSTSCATSAADIEKLKIAYHKSKEEEKEREKRKGSVRS